MKNLTDFLDGLIKNEPAPQFDTEEFKNKLEQVHMRNCLELFKNLHKYNLVELVTMFNIEAQKESPRVLVMDKLHARILRLVRNSQRKEILGCLKKK
jgi:Mg/Co/Ni transporter MgtE